MKKILSIVLVAVTLFGVLGCKDKKSNVIDENAVYLLSYTKNPKAEVYIGTGFDKVTHKVAVKVEAAKIAEKDNKKVIGIRFFLDEGAESGKAFMAYELGNNVAEKEFTVDKAGCKVVIFDTPVELQENADIYIGYEVTGAGYFLGCETSNSTLMKHSYLYMDNSWQTFKEIGATSYAAYIQALCIGGNYSGEKQHDIVAENIVVDKNVRAGDVVNYSFDVRNAGVITTGKIEVECRYGDQVVSSTASGLRNGEISTIEGTINGIGADVKTLTVVVKEVDVTDENAKDNTASTSINVYAADAPQRTCILIEEFTSQSCPNCPDAIENLRTSIAGMKNPEKAAWIAHHSGYVDDIFTMNGDLTIATKFGVNAAPMCMIDRMPVNYAGNTSELVWHPGYATSALLDLLTGIPANATINMELEFNRADSILTVNLDGMTYPKECYVTVVLCQNGYIASQSSGGSNYEHNEVVRYYMTAAMGDALTLDSDSKYDVQYSYKIPASIKGETSKGSEIATDIDNMYVVAFVHGKGTGSVYNATKADIPTSAPSANRR